MQTLPGFRDFLPDACAARNYIFARWREVTRRYGFLEWDGPLLEPTDLYQKKSGAEIIDQLFNFTDKGEREVAMRPELTPTLARVIAAHEREFKKPLKWFSIGQFFRYEKQQRGRLREHFQLNCDIVGEAAPAADIELLALCTDLLRAFGFTEKDFVVRISDREFWTDFLREKDVPPDRWDDVLQVIDKFGREPREKTVETLGGLADPVLKIMGDVVLGELINETPHARKQMQDAVAAEHKIDIYIVIAKEERRADAFSQIQQLRDRGYRVEYPLTPAKVARQFQAAEDAGAALALLYGDEWPQVKMKDMASGEQQLVPQDRL